MFSTTLATLAAVAALNAPHQTSSPATTLPLVSLAPADVTAVQTTKSEPRAKARIPGTFDVIDGADPLDGAQALYLVRTGDGA